MMYNPPHVGEIFRDLYLEPLNLSVTDVAIHLGVSRQAIYDLKSEKAGVSAEMAIRLSKAFNTSAEYWVNLQKQHELWEAMQREGSIEVVPFENVA
jgi:addiction module HigA family antidote